MTQSQLKTLLHYNSKDGTFTRLKDKPKTPSTVNNHGYIFVWVNGKYFTAHRLAWLYVYGVMPSNIDHINHKRHDNRIVNLREVTHSDNCKNKALRKNNKSGFNGVCYVKSRNKWQVQLRVNNRDVWIGRFSNREDAIKARQEANIKYGFHKNHGVRYGI